MGQEQNRRNQFVKKDTFSTDPASGRAREQEYVDWIGFNMDAGGDIETVIVGAVVDEELLSNR